MNKVKIKIFTFISSVFFILFALISNVAAKEFRLLLTTFDPFSQRPKNNTQEIVKKLKTMFVSINVEVCNLPVVYDKAAEVAMQCIQRYKPDAVISFGEGYCSIQLETAANNWDNTPKVADSSGEVRQGNEIIPGATPRLGFTFPVSSLYCGQDTAMLVQTSIDTGAFVCNNTAYHLSQALKALSVPFTFIHVPNTTCPPDKMDPMRNALVLAKTITFAVKKLQDYPTLTTMPIDRKETEALLKQLHEQNAQRCEIEFAESIRGAYG